MPRNFKLLEELENGAKYPPLLVLEPYVTALYMIGEKGSIGDGQVSYGLTDPEDISLSNCAHCPLISR